ncbi:MAG: hypothetical protein KGL39_19885 [Patescibacteria group bacterium]|nr:hypothetical protein [Patescibacteria group bacterium]
MMELNEWLEQTSEARAKLLTYSKTRLPADATERHLDMDELLQNEHDAYVLLEEAKSFAIEAEAVATQKIRRDYSDYTAGERRVMVKREIKNVVELVAGLSILARTLSSRRFAEMNAARAQ